MWNKIKSIFKFDKGSTTLGFTQFSASIIAGVFTILMAPILGAENLGTIGYFFAVISIVTALSSLGAPTILLVYISKGVKLFSTISFLAILSTTISAIIVYFIFDEIILVIVIIAHIIFELAINELLAKQLYVKHMKYFLSQRILFVTLSIPMFFLMGYVGFILMYGLSMLPSIVRIYFGFKESKINFILIKERSHFLINNYLVSVSRTAYTFVDRLIILPIFGSAVLGNYELAMQGIILANVFAVFISSYLMPKDARKQPTYKIKIYSIIGSIFISLFLIFMAPSVLSTLFPKFENAVTFIPIMALSIVPHILVILYTSKFFSLENSRIIFISSVIHFIALVSAILILTNYYSTMGLVVGFVIGEIVEAGFLMVMCKKYFKSFL